MNLIAENQSYLENNLKMTIKCLTVIMILPTPAITKILIQNINPVSKTKTAIRTAKTVTMKAADLTTKVVKMNKTKKKVKKNISMIKVRMINHRQPIIYIITLIIQKFPIRENRKMQLKISRMATSKTCVIFS